MKKLITKTVSIIAILTLVATFYAKYGESSPVIYNEIRSAEDHDIERYINQQLEDEEYEKLKQEQFDSVMIQTRGEQQI